jgi:hypothetical protein
MRSTLAVAAVCAALLVGSLGTRVSGSTGPIPLDCNRACLENVIDQYLKAVVAHDPSKLPLSKDVMYTENNQVMDVGDGFWKTAQGLGNYRHVFADPEFGQVAMMGTMMEAGAPLLMSLRLRVELGRITEIESIYFKPGGGGPNNIAAMDKMGKAEDLWFRTIPPAQRLPRQQMISIADAYFSGLQKNDGKGVNGSPTYPFTNDCHRIENGGDSTNAKTSRDGGPRPDPKTATGYSAMWTCREQFESGMLHFVMRIRDRRYVAVDEERGVVAAYVFFDHDAGKSRTFTTPTGRTMTAGPMQPWTWEIMEFFKVEDGQLHEIEAVLERAPYGMNSGWSSWEDGMSDKIQFDGGK